MEGLRSRSPYRAPYLPLPVTAAIDDAGFQDSAATGYRGDPGGATLERSQAARKRKRTRRLPWEDRSDRELLETRLCDLGVTLEGSWLEEPIRSVCRELEARDLRIRPNFWLSDDWFSPEGVVGSRAPVLPRASEAHASRAQADARGRGRHGPTVHEAPAPRARPRRAARLRPASPPPLARPLRQLVPALPRILPAEPREPPLRAAPRLLVRAGPPRRGLRRDLRGLADAGLALAQALRRMAGAAQARVRRRADVGARGQGAARRGPGHASSRLGKLRQTLHEYYEAKHERYSGVANNIYDSDLRRLFAERTTGTAARTAKRRRASCAGTGRASDGWSREAPGNASTHSKSCSAT